MARRMLSEVEGEIQHAEIEDIFNAHADFVWRALRRHGLSEADADDALQEVFLVVHRRLDEYEERGALRAWLFAICRQVAAHYLRAAARSERRIRAFGYEDTCLDTPHDAVARKEAIDLVEGFLADLDEHQATVFILMEVEGMTAPEVAAALGVKLNTVYARLRLARRRFEKLLRRKKVAGDHP